MIQGLENIRDIFSIFHDGVITHHQFKDHELWLEIEIRYLAERVEPGFTKFQVVLSSIENVRFTTWPSDLKSEPEIILDVDSIFRPQLDILSGNIKENQIQVICNQSSPDFEYCGGELYFTADTVVVSDEIARSYSIDELGALCEEYWDDWANKKCK